MRYLRTYIVINALMAGVVHASEMTSVEGVPAAEGIAAGEEPPQQAQEPAAELDSALTVSGQNNASVDAVPTEEFSVKPALTPEQGMSQAGDQPLNEEQALPEPTIEDAEREQEQVSRQEQVEIPGMPGKPLFSPVMAAPMVSQESEFSQAEEAPTIPQEDEPVGGLDTVDLQNPQGNWLFKKYWWNSAQERYLQIRELNQKIQDMQIKFFAKRTELDKQILDPFYAEIGISQSDLQRSMQSLMSQLEQEREKQGMLTEEERELVDTVAKDRERLQRLEKDVAAVGTLRDEADRAIDRFMGQKNRVTDLDKNAWEHVREIGRIVNDQQASGLYYKVDSIRKTVKDINAHVEQDLNRFFEQLFTNAREQTERIKGTLQALKEQGIDLKARVQSAQEHDASKEIAPVDEDKEKKATPPQKTGWLSSGSRLFQAAIDVALWQFLQSIWDAIMWLPRRMYSTISSIFR